MSKKKGNFNNIKRGDSVTIKLKRNFFSKSRYISGTVEDAAHYNSLGWEIDLINDKTGFAVRWTSKRDGGEIVLLNNQAAKLKKLGGISRFASVLIGDEVTIKVKRNLFSRSRCLRGTVVEAAYYARKGWDVDLTDAETGELFRWTQWLDGGDLLAVNDRAAM
ncbi:hypothetical protein [Paenibacillus gansuensis]|uniref:Uncharacterized protein n=1 Tax=Paenibacillus gansuensis TaxID=306542 RepID=A0ABW5PGW6_9BACL